MGNSKTYNLRKLLKILRRYDSRFEKQRGTRHFAIYHPDVEGRPERFTVPVHSSGEDIDAPYIKDIIKLFKLPHNLL